MSRTFLRLFLPLPSGKPLAILTLAILVLFAAVFLLERPVLHHTHGSILYPVDNAFIDVTVARNLAFYKVWGVSKFAFQSASSSLLYPIALAPLFFIFGAHLIIPLIINFVAAAYFLLAIQWALIRRRASVMQQGLVLLTIMALTLLPLLVVSGMEYVFQLLFVFLFVEGLTRALQQSERRLPESVYICGALAVASSYEDIIIIVLACLLVGMKQGWKAAGNLAAISVSPILAFGILSLAKHGGFLPNSFLLGGYSIYMVLATLCAMIASAIFILLKPKLALLMLIPLSLPFVIRNWLSLRHFEDDCTEIYDKQYLSANFVHLYYGLWAVGMDEPGVISWFSDGLKLDFTGVASYNVAHSKKADSWSPNYADSLSRKIGVNVIILSVPWHDLDTLSTWKKIATWQIPGKTIDFYTINQYDTARLRKNLRAYQPRLPTDVTVHYY